MIKGYKFLINEEEKERIISLHQTRTSQQYLNEVKIQKETENIEDTDSSSDES